tara:strand:+ start:243 stop:854 length:612 start_codon:yes stop_codon:yes gene_type:complete
MKKIGIDFDNTIVVYNNLFHKIAFENKLIPAELPKNKIIIRDFLRSQNKDHEFTKLQSEVYGNRILDAELAPNIFQSLLKIKDEFKIIIISHKTKYPYSGPKYNLHKAALSWLEKNNFLSRDGLNLKYEDIFFEPTKELKIDTINNSGCSYFIDDLPDILKFVDKKIKRILYLNNQSKPNDNCHYCYKTLDNWINLGEIINTY